MVIVTPVKFRELPVNTTRCGTEYPEVGAEGVREDKGAPTTEGMVPNSRDGANDAPVDDARVDAEEASVPNREDRGGE